MEIFSFINDVFLLWFMNYMEVVSEPKLDILPWEMVGLKVQLAIILCSNSSANLSFLICTSLPHWRRYS